MKASFAPVVKEKKKISRENEIKARAYIMLAFY